MTDTYAISRFRDPARVVALTVLVVVLSAVLLGLLVQRLLFLIGLIALVVLGLRLALGASDREGTLRCDSCAREIPSDSEICPYCFELQKLA